MANHKSPLKCSDIFLVTFDFFFLTINTKQHKSSRVVKSRRESEPTPMSKRELAQIIEQQEWHDPRMWESNGEGVLVRKKKTKYFCDKRDDSDFGEKNKKVTKSMERISNESTATRTTRRTKRTTGKQEETTLAETTTTSGKDDGDEGNERADALDSKEEDDDDDDDDPSSQRDKERKKYVSTENTTTEDSGGKKNEEDAPEEKEKKGEEKEDEEEAVKGVLPSFVEPTPTKAAEKQRKQGKPQYLKPLPTCFYCKTNSHRVEANTLSLDHCNAFINDVNSKPINAIKFKFMDGTIERLAVERALIKEVSSCVTNSKEENNVHGPVTGAEVVELNQRVATVLEPVAKQKPKQPVAAARVSYTEKLKELQTKQHAQYVASDGMGIFDAAALLSSFSHGMQDPSGKKSGRRKRKGSIGSGSSIEKEEPPSPSAVDDNTTVGEPEVKLKYTKKERIKKQNGALSSGSAAERKRKYEESIQTFLKLTSVGGQTNEPDEPVKTSARDKANSRSRVETDALTLFSGGKWRMVQKEGMAEVKGAAQVECEVHTLKDSGEGTSYAEALEKSKAEKEARDVAKESNRNENREERGEKAKAITMRTKEEHESFVSTETKTDHVAAVLKPKRRRFANNPSFGITRAMIEQRFHMPLAEAAKECGVGRTTFKRVLRSHGIERWPSQSIYNRAVTKKAIQTLLSLPMSTMETNLKAQTLDVPNANTASHGELRDQDQKKQLESKVSNGTFAKNSNGVEEKNPPPSTPSDSKNTRDLVDGAVAISPDTSKLNRDEEEIEEDATMPLQANQNIVTLADISPTGLGVALNKGTSLARNE